MTADPRTETLTFNLTLRKSVANDLNRAACEEEVSMATYLETVIARHVLNVRNRWNTIGIREEMADVPPPPPVKDVTEEDAATPAVAYAYKVHAVDKIEPNGVRRSVCGYHLNNRQPGSHEWDDVTCLRCLSEGKRLGYL